MRLSELKIPESAITQHIRQILRMRKILHWKQHQGLGSIKGVPDIVGVLPGGRALFIEVKTKTGRLSQEQQNFLENATEQGALAFMARSMEEADQKLKEAGY